MAQSVGVFLRGVNVGGVSITAKPLAQCMASLTGITAARTVLATGNVAVVTDLPPEALQASAEAALSRSFAYEAHVVVVTADQLDALIAACPYAADDPDLHAYVTLWSDGNVAEEARATITRDGHECVWLSPTALAWPSRKGESTTHPLTKLFGRKAYAAASTTRNLRTLVKVAAALAALSDAG